MTRWQARVVFHRTDEAGFTLIELTIALVLLGLIMSTLFASLRFGTRASTETSSHLTRVDALQRVRALLKEEVTRAYPYLITTDRTHPKVAFEGGSTSMEFLGVFPESLQQPGRAKVRFALEQTEGHGIQLMLSLVPELSLSREGVHEVLLDAISDADIGYLSNRDGSNPGTWSSTWSDQTVLPKLIRIRIKFNDSNPYAWPDMLIAPRIDVDAGCMYDALTRYCAGR